MSDVKSKVKMYKCKRCNSSWPQRWPGMPEPMRCHICKSPGWKTVKPIPKYLIEHKSVGEA